MVQNRGRFKFCYNDSREITDVGYVRDAQVMTLANSRIYKPDEQFNLKFCTRIWTAVIWFVSFLIEKAMLCMNYEVKSNGRWLVSHLTGNGILYNYAWNVHCQRRPLNDFSAINQLMWKWLLLVLDILFNNVFAHRMK